MKVEALQMGYYKLKRRKEGEQFHLKSDEDFSKKWMKKVDEKAKTSTPAKKEPAKKASSNKEVI